jgi:hypothetical protein
MDGSDLSVAGPMNQTSIQAILEIRAGVVWKYTSTPHFAVSRRIYNDHVKALTSTSFRDNPQVIKPPAWHSSTLYM